MKLKNSRRAKAARADAKPAERGRIQLSVPDIRAEINRRVLTLAPQLNRRGLTVEIMQREVLNAVVLANSTDRPTDTRDRRKKAQRALVKAAAALQQIVAPVYHEDIIKRAPRLVLRGKRLVAAPSRRTPARQLPPLPKTPPGNLSDMLIQTANYMGAAPRMTRREDSSERLRSIVQSLAGSLCALRVSRRPSLIKILIDRVILNEAPLDGHIPYQGALTASRFRKIYYSLPRALVSFTS